MPRPRLSGWCRYPDDFDAKRAARYFLYERARRLFATVGTPSGWAVVLAGHEAAEVGALRYLLNWPPDQVLFVDVQPMGLERVQSRWPQAHTYWGDLRDILPSLEGGIGFANLDFMGYLRPDIQACIAQVGGLLTPGAFIAYTFPRGRENAYSRRYSRLIERAARDHLIDHPDLISKVTSHDHVRILGYSAAVRALLDRPALYPAGVILYRRRIGMAMGSTSFHHVPPPLPCRAWREVIADTRSIHIGPDASTLVGSVYETLVERLGSRQAVDILHL